MIEDLWYKNAVIYALNVDSFMDGNGDGCGNSVVVLHNFSTRPREARFQVNHPEGGVLSNLLVNEEVRADLDGVHKIALESYGYRWFRVGGLSYALHVQRDSGAGVKW